MNFKEDVRKSFGIILSNEQLEQFAIYYQELIEYNKHTNLTAITDEHEVYYKHFYDSLTLIPFIKNDNLSLCDMGSGAGFPSIPLKIVYPNLNITIIDSVNKKIKFLSSLIEKLNLSNIKLVNGRIEEFA